MKHIFTSNLSFSLNKMINEQVSYVACKHDHDDVCFGVLVENDSRCSCLGRDLKFIGKVPKMIMTWLCAL